MNKKRYESVAESAAERLNLPAGVVSGLPTVEIAGGRQVTVERHRGLIEYNQDEIAVNTDGGILRVKGGGLEIRAMTAERLIITGEIRCVEL